jgi:hypothetical protein
VLGGQGMKIVINKQELEEHVVNLLKTIPGNKLLLDHYLMVRLKQKLMLFVTEKMCTS